jgi:hypothetical protein
MQNFLSWTFKNIYIVIWSCMLLEDIMQILLCWCHKYLWINFFSLGDMYNVLRHWANSLHEHNIVLRIWNMCILYVENCPRQKKPKHYSLTTIQKRPLKISSVIVSSLNLLENNVKEWNPMYPCFCLLLTLVWLPLVTTHGVHYEMIVTYFKHCLTFFSTTYF